MRDLLLTALYVGKIKFAPGTWGSLAGLIAGLPILLFSGETLFLCACLLGLFSVRQIDIYENLGGAHDDKSIVIDEVVGVWIAMSFVWVGDVNFHNFADFEVSHAPFWVGVVASFTLFRLFDIWKPSFIGRIDRDVKGGAGVVGDDALAGVVAGVFVWCACFFTAQILGINF